MDVFEAGPGGQFGDQIHDFNPGITENGLFWVVPISRSNVSINPGKGRASLQVSDLEVEDYFTFENSLTEAIPEIDADVSFNMQWSSVIDRIKFRNPAQGFAAEFARTSATLEWSAETQLASFESDPASTTTVYAEIGHERNGVFFL